MARNWILTVFIIVYFNLYTPIFASPHCGLDSRNTTSAANRIVTRSPLHNLSLGDTDLRKREDDDSETCGYHDGDPERPRTAENGFDCRIDTERGLWGFCPTTVIAASDCGLAGSCVDRHACSRGCGVRDTSGITTFTCKSDQFCSTVILALNDDAGFSYIACGATALTHTIFQTPTDDPRTRPTEPAATKSSLAESSKPSELEGSSTPTSEPEPASDGEDSGSPPNNTGAIIGGVIGGLALVCISAVATVYLLRRNRNQKAIEENSQVQGAPMPSFYTHDIYDPTLKEQSVIPELDGRQNSKPSELPG